MTSKMLFTNSGEPNSEKKVSTSLSQGLGNLKSVITGDTVSIERKYKESFDYSFHGLVLQCVNDFPKAFQRGQNPNTIFYTPHKENLLPGVNPTYIQEESLSGTGNNTGANGGDS